jgi:hypothetical protein
MSPLLTIFLALLAGTLGGIASGGLAGWWLCRRRIAHVPFDHDAIDPDVDRQIDAAADRWAAAHDRPGTASLIARKLRLAYLLQQRRTRRRRWEQW